MRNTTKNYLLKWKARTDGNGIVCRLRLYEITSEKA